MRPVSCTFRSVLELLPNSSGTPNPAIVPGATGNRNNASGALVSVGTWGAYYASSPLLAGNVNASHLAYGSGDLHPLNNANRANALSVRCVQASAKLF